MNCMKCGRETVLGQVFCKECLDRMEQYPIKPDTPVLLPSRTVAAGPRRTSQSRKIRKPEEKIARMRTVILIQTMVLVVMLAVFIITVMSLTGQMDEGEPEVLPGQNYSTLETTQTP